MGEAPSSTAPPAPSVAEPRTPAWLVLLAVVTGFANLLPFLLIFSIPATVVLLVVMTTQPRDTGRRTAMTCLVAGLVVTALWLVTSVAVTTEVAGDAHPVPVAEPEAG